MADEPDTKPDETPGDDIPLEEAVDNAEATEDDAVASDSAEDPKRREFMAKAAAGVLGAGIVACPAVAGLIPVMGPMFNKTGDGVEVRLTNLEVLPDDGVPRAFKVVADKVDAWTTHRDLPLGMVYLRRTESGVEAFNARCPHAGCAVEYFDTEKNGPHYYCPCHESSFGIDGSVGETRSGKKSPALRGLDSLEINQEKLAEGEVWVKFLNYKPGVKDKVTA